MDNRRLKEHLQNQQTAVKEEVAAVTRSLLFNIHFISLFYPSVIALASKQVGKDFF